MQIHNNYYSQMLKTNKTATKKKETQSFPHIEKKTNIRTTQNENMDIFTEISKKYNVKKATYKEICEIAQKLYSAGKISLLECGVLTFNPSEMHNHLEGDINVTTPNPDGTRDWIKEFRGRSCRSMRYGNMQNCIVDNKIINVLEQCFQ